MLDDMVCLRDTSGICGSVVVFSVENKDVTATGGLEFVWGVDDKV